MVPLQGAAFMVLLVLFGAGSTVHGTVIPEPQNVMIKCENQIPIVQWNYSHLQPRPTFSVNISGSAGTHEYKTTDHQVDLSQFVWKSEDQYMAYHIVTVTAVMGGKESTSVTSKSFSFNELKAADITCRLDFPPANLTVDKSEATVSLPNPFSFYPELKQASKPTSAFFEYQISASGSDYKARCRVDQKICKYEFSFPENVETCIKLKGSLMKGNEIGHVVVRETDDVCPTTPSMGNHWGIVILILVVFILFVTIISFIICKVSAWTMKTPPLPESLLPPEPNLRRLERYSMLDSNAVMNCVQVVDINSSFDSTEEEEVSPTAVLWDGSSGPGPQSPSRDSFYTEGRLSGSSSSQEAMGLMSEGETTDGDSANGSVETESVSMNSTEEEGEGEAASPYDRPHILQIDMGDGDTATGYTGS